MATVSQAAFSQSTHKALERGVQEREAGEVRRADGVAEEIREEGAGEIVRVDDVQPTVQHAGGNPGHRVDNPRHARADMLQGGAPSRGPLGVRGADEVEQMSVFGVVELERLADGLEDALGDSPRVPALEPGVVLDTDAREERDLLAPQARNAAMPAPPR
jgi:hypothetical protein